MFLVTSCQAGDTESNCGSCHRDFTMIIMSSHCFLLHGGGNTAPRLEMEHGGVAAAVSHCGHLLTVFLGPCLGLLHPVLVPKFCVSFENYTNLLGRHPSVMLSSSSLLSIAFPFFSLQSWLRGSSTASEVSGACRETTLSGREDENRCLRHL